MLGLSESELVTKSELSVEGMLKSEQLTEEEFTRLKISSGLILKRSGVVLETEEPEAVEILREKQDVFILNFG